MNVNGLENCLTDEESQKFEQDGFFIIEDAISMEKVTALTTVVDRLDAQYRQDNGLGPNDTVNMLDFVGKDDIFLDLLDLPKTFSKVWGILGWNIQLYHSHMIITPPRKTDNGEQPATFAQVGGRGLGWHQDSGRLNHELEGSPRPRVSLKVAFFLSDTTEPGRGNFRVVPGSHLHNKIDVPTDGSDPTGAVDVRVRPGTVVFFDRRIWHTATMNVSDVTRKVLFYGYSYRWLRPRDNMTVDHYMDRVDPIRQQLLGKSINGGMGYTSPREEDVPLRTWMRENLGEAAVA